MRMAMISVWTHSVNETGTTKISMCTIAFSKKRCNNNINNDDDNDEDYK